MLSRPSANRSRTQFSLLTLSWAACLVGCVARPLHLVEDLAAQSPDGRVQVVVEIPAGTLAKYEVDRRTGLLDWQWEDGAPRVVRYLGYPGNYGMVPRTVSPKDDGGDGDPLDALVLGDAVTRGTVLNVRLIGVLRMTDEGERDDKLIGVVDGSPFESVGSIEELQSNFPGVTEIVETWFRNYEGPAPGGVSTTSVEGYGGAETARGILAAACEAFEADS